MRTSMSAAIVIATLVGGFDLGSEGIAAWVLVSRGGCQPRVQVEPTGEQVATTPFFALHEMQSQAERELEQRPQVAVTRKAAGVAFDSSDASVVLDTLSTTVGICRLQGGTRGEGVAMVLFANTGSVRAVVLGERYKGAPEASCLMRRFQRASVAPYDGPEQAMRVRFAL